MDRKTIGRMATMSLMLGVSTIGCTPGGQGGHPATLASQAPKPDKPALRAAAQARVALAAHQGLAAVAAAEQAVAFQPNDAGYRMLLGQSYLAAGRFGSAEASFRDSLTLSPDQPKAQFDLALAQIAQGRGGDAQSTLHALNGAIPAGDVGLALALSGDRQGAIKILTDLVRSGKSDARSRQNLALAFALDGRWAEARAVAMQDTTPGQDRRPARALGGPRQADRDRFDADRIDARRDAGRRSGLAGRARAGLAGPADGCGSGCARRRRRPGRRDAGSRARDGDCSRRRDGDQLGDGAARRADPGGDACRCAGRRRHARRAGASAARPVDAAAAAARAGAAVPVGAARSADACADVPVERLCRPARRLCARRRDPDRLVAGIEADAAARPGSPPRAPSSASRAPRSSGLSVSGFADRASAVGMCSQIRAKGGECFVRQTAGDSAIQWAKRDTGVQLAARG